MSIVTWLFIVFGLALVNMLIGTVSIRSFLAHTRSIIFLLFVQLFFVPLLFRS
jgi:hypothetical protein